jgi:hypothetical protein
VNKETRRHLEPYLTQYGKNTTRPVYYQPTEKKDFSNFPKEIEARIKYEIKPIIVIEKPEIFWWKFPTRPDIQYNGKKKEFRTSSKTKDMKEASNQCCHIAHTMKKLGYLKVKYGKRKKRRNVEAEYPCEWKDRSIKTRKIIDEARES